MDLNVKTEMYAVNNSNEHMQKDADVIKRKLELQKAGLRKSGQKAQAFDLSGRHK